MSIKRLLEKKRDSPCKSWDITTWSDVVTEKGKKRINDVLTIIAEKSVWQVEESKAKNKHGQIRLRLKDKLRQGQVIELLKGHGLEGHVSRTSKLVHAGKNFNYVMKEETRIDGPWTIGEIKDGEPERKWKIILDPGVHEEMSRFEDCWLPWQKQILDSVKVKDFDHINVLLDREGLQGMSQKSNWS